MKFKYSDNTYYLDRCTPLSCSSARGSSNRAVLGMEPGKPILGTSLRFYPIEDGLPGGWVRLVVLF